MKKKKEGELFLDDSTLSHQLLVEYIDDIVQDREKEKIKKIYLSLMK